jgi:hypothetical protein
MDWYAFVGPVMIMLLFGLIFLIMIDAKSVPSRDQWQDLVLPPAHNDAARERRAWRRWHHGAP